MASDNHPKTPVPVNVAARCLGVKAADVLAEYQAGRLPGVICGGTLLIHVPSAAEWLANRAARSLPVRTIADMLADLRSEDLNRRYRGMIDLAKSIGAGMAIQGLDQLDAEFGVGRDLSVLLSKAAVGDAAAVDQLERVLTNKITEAAATAPAEPGRTIRSAGEAAA